MAGGYLPPADQAERLGLEMLYFLSQNCEDECGPDGSLGRR